MGGDRLPVPYPRGPNNNEWELLEKPFPVTDEEGEVLSQLMPYGEHVDDIAQRLGRDKNELIPLLDSLLHKTWVGREGTKEDGSYRVLPWFPGLSEMWQIHFDTPEFREFFQTHISPDPQARHLTLFGAPDELPRFRVLPREDAIPYIERLRKQH